MIEAKELSVAAWKTCPQCGTEAPTSAFRCKQCMHEYGHKKERSWGPILLLGTFAAMTLFAGGVFFYASARPLEFSSVVDPETQSIRFVTTYGTGPVTENVRFDHISRLVHEHMKDGSFEMYIVTTDGQKKLLLSGNEPMTSQVARYGDMMKKPVDTIDDAKVD